MKGLSFDLLKIRNFRLLLLTRMFAVAALQSQVVIVGWQIYKITGSEWYLGLTGLVEAVPAVICALYAGHVVDVSHPKKVYAWCLAALCLNTFVLVLFAGGFIAVSEWWVVAIIFGGIFFSGFARSFVMPSAFSLLALIVRREDMSSATSWQTTCFQIAAIGAPSVTGIIIGVYGTQVAWLLPLAFMSMATAMVVMMQVHKEPIAKDKRPKAWNNIKEGWVFLLQNRSLLSIMSLDMLAVLFGGAVAILPAFADQVLHTGAEGFGLLRAAPAIGAVLTAFYFALKPMKQITAIRLLIVVGGFGFSIIGFGLSTSLAAAFIFLFLSGAFDSVSMVIRGTLMQLLTPEHMRGRVSSVNSMFIISSNELGTFVSGSSATIFGLVPSIIIGGTGTLVVVGAVAGLSKGFRKLRIET